MFQVNHTHTLAVKGGVTSLLALVTGAGISFYLYFRLKGKTNSLNIPFREFIFFPDDRPTCKALYMERQGCHDPKCGYSHNRNSSFNKLMNHLKSARQSLDLCVFCFTSPELADVVITLHKRGVRVRLITDKEQIDASHSHSQVGKFRREGILVRHNSSSYLMHHKFAVIDKRKLINGSFNWTRQAVMGNNENVLITTETADVASFLAEFEKLWVQFNPNKP